jgi:hypothetical protein
VIEITCSRCSLNIDEFEQVTLVYDPETGDPKAIHDTCEKPDDVKGMILHAHNMTDDDMVLLYYNMITFAEQRSQLQRDYTELNAQYQGMIEYARQRNQVIGELRDELKRIYQVVGEITVRMNPDMSPLTGEPDAPA